MGCVTPKAILVPLSNDLIMVFAGKILRLDTVSKKRTASPEIVNGKTNRAGDSGIAGIQAEIRSRLANYRAN